MNRNIPQISISKVMLFNAAGMPDSEQFEITATIDTADEFTALGRIRFEDPSDLVALSKILDSYIRINDLDCPDADEEEVDDEVDNCFNISEPTNQQSEHGFIR